MSTKAQWIVLLFLMQGMIVTGGWGLEQWTNRFSSAPLMAGGWMVLCALQVVFGKTFFALLLSLAVKVNQR